MSEAATPVLYLLVGDLPWWPALARLAEAGRDDGDAAARATLIRALVTDRLADPESGLADALLFGASPAWASAPEAEGVHRALAADVDAVARAARCVRERDGSTGAPPVCDLGPPAQGPVATLRAMIVAGEPADAIVEHALEVRRTAGGGPLGRYRAFRWTPDGLRGVPRPAAPDLDALVDLTQPIDTLVRNTEAFLDGRPAMHALLYGPRGSGKSTVVRGLLDRYADRGLRLVELPGEALADLPNVLEDLHDRPERYLLFVDDLSFESGDVRYHPLKSLLEGSVAARPENVRLYATSNRRHLVQERLRDRPDPLDDDVHAWDTQNERLALADRFGLLVTFPSADKRRYLAIVRHLADGEEVEVSDLEARADRFARAGNGYSGRTARQFVDAVRAGLA